MVEIPLKKKYLVGGKSKFQGGERPDRHGSKKRKKLSDALKLKLPPQNKRVLVVDGRTGKSVMKDL